MHAQQGGIVETFHGYGRATWRACEIRSDTQGNMSRLAVCVLGSLLGVAEKHALLALASTQKLTNMQDTGG